MLRLVGSRELRPRLSEWLEKAKAGDDVVVLVYGHPAALLRPVRPDDDGAMVASRFMRDDLHDVIRRAQGTALLVTWHGRMYAVLEAPPGGLEIKEEEAS
jgi:hypothetical protein